MSSSITVGTFKYQLLVLFKYFIKQRVEVEFKHKPVLLNECIEGLNIKPDGIYVDGTLRGSRS